MTLRFVHIASRKEHLLAAIDLDGSARCVSGVRTLLDLAN